MLVACLFIIVGAGCLGGGVALFIRPLNAVRVARGFVQCGLGGIYFSVAWWLASFTPSQWLFRYLLYSVVGFVGLSSVIYTLIALAGLRDNNSL